MLVDSRYKILTQTDVCVLRYYYKMMGLFDRKYDLTVIKILLGMVSLIYDTTRNRRHLTSARLHDTYMTLT